MPHSFAPTLASPYYYDHFQQMIDFGLKVHGNVLTDAERQFVEDFKTLTIQSQCLYIRMTNRTRSLFHLNDLLYDEIGTCDAIDELMAHGYLRSLKASDYSDLLSSFTKASLIAFSKIHNLDGVRANWKKDAIATHFLNHISFPDFVNSLDDQHYYVPLRCEHLSRFKQWWKPKFDKGFYQSAHQHHPGQTYVVVDVETTGMSTPLGRITEIGAVKMRDGQIIGEWTSLINPDSHIPPFITGITGIDNEMVREAPYFYQIADEFEQFLGDAVFVAHNVNFDYGFISAEFKRLGKELRRMKLCTVESMRIYYPGHSSYSLANLCKEYAISLAHHHRALCDAQAAAQLLLLINERRQHDIQSVL